jgi:hypothetical protein
MATTKRERQRANREQAQEQAKKDESRAKVFERAKRWSKFALIFAAALVASNLIVGSCSGETTSTTTTTLVETTVAP